MKCISGHIIKLIYNKLEWIDNQDAIRCIHEDDCNKIRRSKTERTKASARYKKE